MILDLPSNVTSTYQLICPPNLIQHMINSTMLSHFIHQRIITDIIQDKYESEKMISRKHDITPYASKNKNDYMIKECYVQLSSSKNEDDKMINIPNGSQEN